MASVQTYTMTGELAQRVTTYLENKSYKIAKPIMDGLKEVKADNGDIVYQIDTSLIIHLLDQIMLNEDNIRTFMLLRVGYENLMKRTQPVTPPTATPDNIDAPAPEAPEVDVPAPDVPDAVAPE